MIPATASHSSGIVAPPNAVRNTAIQASHSASSGWKYENKFGTSVIGPHYDSPFDRSTPWG